MKEWQFSITSSLKNNTDRNVQTEYYQTKVEIKVYNFMIGDRNLLDEPTKGDIRAFESRNKSIQFYDWWSKLSWWTY